MTLTIEATYEDGVLKPTEPLPLKQNEKMRVTVHTEFSTLLQAYGIMGWKGSHETLEQIHAEAEELS